MNATDRCDKCGSQAYVWANGISGELLFCKHHFERWEPAIRAYAFEIVDERERLLNPIASSANS